MPDPPFLQPPDEVVPVESTSLTWLIRFLEQEISGQSARNACAILSTYHRIQASPGYSDAAFHCLQELRANGLEAEILRFPAKIGEKFWALKSFEYWSIRSALLQAILPSGDRITLANFREHPLSVIQRSKATPSNGILAPIVDVGSGESLEDYEGLDIAGKFVLCTGNETHVQRLACEQRGAVGIVKESRFETDDLTSALKYSSFWWERPGPKALGFVISPAQAYWLRETLSESGMKGVQLQAVVDAEFREGDLEIVTATIPGQSDEEIILVSHLCHPAPGADDNASGVAACLEIMRAFANLIRQGELVQPQRTIRLVLLPETTGGYAYLAYREKQGNLDRIKCGLNIDMVGQDQAKCGGSFILALAPDACVSFVNVVLKWLFQLLCRESRKFSGYPDYPLFRWSYQPFEGGSDNYVFCDPSVSIPMPNIVQWPSKFYHSSADTIDHVDPLALLRSAVLSGTFIYFLANMGVSEVEWVAKLLLTDFQRQILSETETVEFDSYLRKSVTTNMVGRRPLKPKRSIKDFRQKIAYHKMITSAALSSLKEFVPIRESQTFADIYKAAITDLEAMKSLFVSKRLNEKQEQDKGDERVEIYKIPQSDLELRAGKLIPTRLWKGPVDLSLRFPDFEEEDWESYDRFRQQHSPSKSKIALACYWIDGQKSIFEIACLLYHERGWDALPFLMDYYELLERYGLIKIEKPS
ncbi:MAG: DUF4910 domain-containing protein [Candidatus Hodarchaeales archaeon]